MPVSQIERAERSARSRAVVMALLAAVLALTATFGFDNPANDGPVRGIAWLVELLLALLVLTTGGGLMLSRQLRALMNDELSRHNRSRGLTTGFFAALLVGTALYVISWWAPIDLRAGLRLVTGLTVATAMAHYAWLEWRQV
jgi:hypothetical protein